MEDYEVKKARLDELREAARDTKPSSEFWPKAGRFLKSLQGLTFLRMPMSRQDQTPIENHSPHPFQQLLPHHVYHTTKAVFPLKTESGLCQRFVSEVERWVQRSEILGMKNPSENSPSG
jgi:hypothetical protein